MTYSVEISVSVKRDIASLERALQERIVALLERVRTRPFSFAIRVVGSPFYRFRVGDYRIIAKISIPEKRILVVKVGHREGVYC